jgi:hypothetical protein
VEDMKPDPDCATLYAMKIQADGPEYRVELKTLGQLNSKRIVQLKKGRINFTFKHFFIYTL